MNTKEISIANEFTRAPAGRYITDGPYSGERFRDELLMPALNTVDKVIVNLDGTLGYGSSFLEEAFGGLIRERGFALDELIAKIEIKSSRTIYKRKITQYLTDAEAIRRRK